MISVASVACIIGRHGPSTSSMGGEASWNEKSWSMKASTKSKVTFFTSISGCSEG